jgi:hypothetical protein
MRLFTPFLAHGMTAVISALTFTTVFCSRDQAAVIVSAMSRSMRQAEVVQSLQTRLTYYDLPHGHGTGLGCVERDSCPSPTVLTHIS